MKKLNVSEIKLNSFPGNVHEKLKQEVYWFANNLTAPHLYLKVHKIFIEGDTIEETKKKFETYIEKLSKTYYWIGINLRFYEREENEVLYYLSNPKSNYHFICNISAVQKVIEGFECVKDIIKPENCALSEEHSHYEMDKEQTIEKARIIDTNIKVKPNVVSLLLESDSKILIKLDLPYFNNIDSALEFVNKCSDLNAYEILLNEVQTILEEKNILNFHIEKNSAFYLPQQESWRIKIKISFNSQYPTSDLISWFSKFKNVGVPKMREATCVSISKDITIKEIIQYIKENCNG